MTLFAIGFVENPGIEFSAYLGGPPCLGGKRTSKSLRHRDTESHRYHPEKDLPHLRRQPFRYQRERTQAYARAVEDRIPDGGRQADNRSLAGAGRRNVFAIDQHDFNRRRILETWHLIIGKPRIENLSVFELNGFEESAANRLRDRAFDLVLQVKWIHHCATIKCLDHAHYPNLRVLLLLGIFAGWFFNRYLSTRRDVSTFFKSAGDTD